ncbi:VanZ family protein [Akkermansiaceae bacterium]|nr:VanZ family protein [Akkermansiaceae bacterium]MDB4508159.1 VanZ family protein [Akkermansiaceae bacterium]MDB4541472.1 VanZ family protein [Akkermansiaceae bacterium]
MELSHFDRLGYFILIGILTFLAILAIASRLKSSLKKAAIKIVVVLLILIAAEEILQIFIPSRSFSIGDFICNLAGVLIAA